MNLFFYLAFVFVNICFLKNINANESKEYFEEYSDEDMEDIDISSFIISIKHATSKFKYEDSELFKNTYQKFFDTKHIGYMGKTNVTSFNKKTCVCFYKKQSTTTCKLPEYCGVVLRQMVYRNLFGKEIWADIGTRYFYKTYSFQDYYSVYEIKVNNFNYFKYTFKNQLSINETNYNSIEVSDLDYFGILKHLYFVKTENNNWLIIPKICDNMYQLLTLDKVPKLPTGSFFSRKFSNIYKGIKQACVTQINIKSVIQYCQKKFPYQNLKDAIVDLNLFFKNNIISRPYKKSSNAYGFLIDYNFENGKFVYASTLDIKNKQVEITENNIITQNSMHKTDYIKTECFNIVE